ncbi:MAG: hypothetical protein IJE21_03450 [Alistipes sp.]|nr:hypothetical protein [Alistipes sp.]
MKYTPLYGQTFGEGLYTAPELCIYEIPAEQGFQVSDRADNDYGDEDLGDDL